MPTDYINPKTTRFYILILCLLMLVVGGGFWSLIVGEVKFDLMTLFTTSWKDLDNTIYLAVYQVRLPRIILAFLGGGILGLAGALLQSVSKNVLASPDTIGVSHSAVLFVILGGVLFNSQNIWLNLSLSIGGAACGLVLIYFLAVKNNKILALRLILVGISCSIVFQALSQLLLLIAPSDITSLLTFISGSVYAATWAEVLLLLPVFIVMLFLLPVVPSVLDRMLLGDDVASSLGVDLIRIRILILLAVIVLVGFAIFGLGNIGFIGLIAPNIARLLIGHLHRYVLPFSIIIGGLLVLLADTIGNTMISPTEIPAGIVSNLIGVPIFLILLMQQKNITKV